MIYSFDVHLHPYADGTQFYTSLSVSNAEEPLEKLQHCLIGVSAWMTGAKMKFHPGKKAYLFYLSYLL